MSETQDVQMRDPKQDGNEDSSDDDSMDDNQSRRDEAEELETEEFVMGEFTQEEETVPVQTFEVGSQAGQAIYEFCRMLIELNLKRENRKKLTDEANEYKKSLILRLNQFLLNYNTDCIPVWNSTESGRITYLKRITKSYLPKQTKKQLENTFQCIRQWIGQNRLSEKLPVQLYIGQGQIQPQNMMSIQSTLTHLIKESNREANTKVKISFEVNDKKPSHFPLQKCIPIKDQPLIEACMKFAKAVDRVKTIREKNKKDVKEFKTSFGPLIIPQDGEKNQKLFQLMEIRKKQREARKTTQDEFKPTEYHRQLRLAISSFLKEKGGPKKCFKFQITQPREEKNSQGTLVTIYDVNTYILAEQQCKKSYTLTSEDLEICSKFAMQNVLFNYKIQHDQVFDTNNEYVRNVFSDPSFSKSYQTMFDDCCSSIADERTIYYWKLVLRRSRKNTDRLKDENQRKLAKEESDLNEKLIAERLQNSLGFQQLKRINKEWEKKSKTPTTKKKQIKQKKQTAEEFQNLLIQQQPQATLELPVYQHANLLQQFKSMNSQFPTTIPLFPQSNQQPVPSVVPPSITQQPVRSVQPIQNLPTQSVSQSGPLSNTAPQNSFMQSGQNFLQPNSFTAPPPLSSAPSQQQSAPSQQQSAMPPMPPPQQPITTQTSTPKQILPNNTTIQHPMHAKVAQPSQPLGIPKSTTTTTTTTTQQARPTNTVSPQQQPSTGTVQRPSPQQQSPQQAPQQAQQQAPQQQAQNNQVQPTATVVQKPPTTTQVLPSTKK